MSSATLVVGSAGREQLEPAPLLLFRPCAALLAALGGTQGHCYHHRQLDPGLARCTGQRRPLSDIRGALGWTELGPAGSAVVVVSCTVRSCPPCGHVKYTAGVHVVVLPPDASRHDYFASLPELKVGWSVAAALGAAPSSKVHLVQQGELRQSSCPADALQVQMHDGGFRKIARCTGQRHTVTGLRSGRTYRCGCTRLGRGKDGCRMSWKHARLKRWQCMFQITRSPAVLSHPCLQLYCAGCERGRARPLQPHFRGHNSWVSRRWLSILSRAVEPQSAAEAAAPTPDTGTAAAGAAGACTS